MAYNPQDMLNAVAVVTSTLWTEIQPGNGGGGQYFVNQVMKEGFEAVTSADAEVGDTGAFPVTVLWLKPANAEEWGLSNEAMAAELEIFYVAETAINDSAVWGKLTSLHTPLFAASDANTLAGLQVHRTTAQNVDPSNPALAFFLNRDVPYNAGSVTFHCLYGESEL